MRKEWIAFFFSFVAVCSYGQVTLNPTISPALFQPSTTITVTYDVTGTSLASLPTAWAWVWIPGATVNAKYNVNPAGSNPTLTDNAKFTKSIEAGRTLFKLTFKPADFFATDISTQTQMGILLKGNDWSNGQTTDYLASFWDGSFQVQLTAPTQRPLFVETSDNITIQAETPIAANYDLFVNNILIDEQDGTLTYSYVHTVTEVAGASTVKLVATVGANSSETTFQYIISGTSPTAARPAGVISGINYSGTDNTKVTLCLLAPGKSSVYALGDFSNWDVLPQNMMKRDGEYFWIELSGLTPGQEYAFQYLVDETLFVADPFADKILDPDDQYIPATTYPNLKTFPAKARHSQWYFNRLSVFQTNQEEYTWQVEDVERPAKEKLVIYELLLRDFFANGQRNYQNLIDTVSYFKRLGITAIQLMPIMEFNGNEGWGYNPTFLFAPDKYYGTKDKFKEFIDVCHQNGIAVILDIAMNHHDLPNPYVMMDFDFTVLPAPGKPKATNKWFNTDARHPYNVFYDMNHESAYTKTYLDTVTYYWLNEFKVDGFRFDLSKGFTQNDRCGGSTSNEGCIAQRDDSRIAILKRMADAIWSHTPDAIVILEHFAANDEEKELAEYRADEGKGMMLWGNLNYAYNQNTMGFSSGSDITGVLHSTRSWSVPHLVGYMESHDEERLMYRNLQSGNSLGNYSTKNLNTALTRVKAASLMFYTLPGPKMLWEFGDLGYEFSINRCEDGSISNDCRLSPKPVKWDYLQNPERRSVHDFVSDVIRLRNTYPVFTEGTAVISGGSGLIKQLSIKSNPYTSAPSSSDEMNVQIAVNFELFSSVVPIAFPHTGTWYDYYNGYRPVDVTGATLNIELQPGQYKLYTDYPIEDPIVIAVEDELRERSVALFPNPAKENIRVALKGARVFEARVYTQQGQSQPLTRLDDQSWDVSALRRGFYIVEFKTDKGVVRRKMIKE